MAETPFAWTRFGHDRLSPAGAIPRHRHRVGYVALVLAGGYAEAGDDGRWRVVAGDALVHAAYGAHRDDVASRGARVLNLPLPLHVLPAGFRVRDPDAIARAAEADLETAAAMLVPSGDIEPEDDWPDTLAAALNADPSLRLDRWAERAGLAAATLSRAFRAVFGVTPARFRAEARTRHALVQLEQGVDSIAHVAQSCGFSDQ